MFLTKIIGLLALVCALVAVEIADGIDPITTTMASTTALSSLDPGDTFSTFVGTIAPVSVTLSPGLFVTTFPANHAPPGTYTRTSSTIQTITTTTTQTFRSTFTVFGPASTVTSHVSEVSLKPSLVTGFCSWGVNRVEIPCTYSVGNKPSSSPTQANESAVITTTVSSAAISSRNNLFKFIIDSVKSLGAPQEGLGRQPSHNATLVLPNGTEISTLSPEYQQFLPKGPDHFKCDHVPILWSPIVMGITYIAHALWVYYKWNEPTVRQAQNGMQVFIFMLFWASAYPMFIYMEVYTSIATAWLMCVPDPNHTY